jgi:hypothetical protein
MNYQEYVRKVYEVLGTNRTLRPGQAYFNVLHDVRPGSANVIRGTHLDPFYDDSRLPEFLRHVESVFNAPPP